MLQCGRTSRQLWLTALLAGAVYAAGCDSEDECIPAPSDRTNYVESYDVQDVSADGNEIVYFHGPSQDGPVGLYLLDLRSGSGPEFLLPWTVGMSLEPDKSKLSPDRTTIAFVRYSEGDIFLFDRETGQERRLTTTYGNATDPDWSPDGTKVVYLRFRLTRPPAEQTGGLFIVDVASGAESPMLYQGERLILRRPRWSPDGKWIAGDTGFNQPTKRVIFIVKVDGTEMRMLSGAGTENSTAVIGWLEDGPELVYENEEAVDCASYAYNIASRKSRILQPNLVMVVIDRYSPVTQDGEWFYYTDWDQSRTTSAIWRNRLEDPLDQPQLITVHHQ